jgi:hypothetical protein
MLDHFDILAPFYDRLMGAPDAEKIVLMQSRFFRPQDIRHMMRIHGLKAEIAVRHRFAAWVVGDKP